MICQSANSLKASKTAAGPKKLFSMQTFVLLEIG
jgi:hypothetical protein